MLVRLELLSHPFTFLSLTPFGSCESIKTTVSLQNKRNDFSEQFLYGTSYLACTFGPTSPSFPGVPGAPAAPTSPYKTQRTKQMKPMHTHVHETI